LKQIKFDFTGVSKIYDRSDNAACYSAANVIAGKAAICEEMGVKLMLTEFNEPHRGKDKCDRDFAVLKSISDLSWKRVRTFVFCEAVFAYGGKYYFKY
jgi:hypothetical protein